jgi:hypothetical protein
LGEDLQHYFKRLSILALVSSTLCLGTSGAEEWKSSSKAEAPASEAIDSPTHLGARAEKAKSTKLQQEPPVEIEEPQPLVDTQDDLGKDNVDDSQCERKRSSPEWIDGMRASTHSRLCKTASWIDGLFGKKERFNGNDFIGKVSLGFRHDEIDGFDPRLRIKVKTDLPNVSKRFNAFVGRVEEDSYISNTEVNNDRLNNVGLRSTGDDENEWLVGLGYRSPDANSNGLDFSLGAKLSGGISPYAKVAHRYLFETAQDKYWRTTQTVFWRKQDGFGVSSKAEFTNILNDVDILVSHASIKYTEEEEQWEWFADTSWHHSLSDKKGISTTAYLRGEAENPVSLPEYGLTFTYIRPFLRDWLSVETGVDLRWEKEYPMGAYKSAIRFGIQFEMQLGNYYSRRKRIK